MSPPVWEPFSIAWEGGACSAGYLGRLRWRCRLSNGLVSEASSVAEATTLLMEDAFGGVPRGEEVRHRAPLLIRAGSRDGFRLIADRRMNNGWTVINERFRADLGGQPKLARWIQSVMAQEAYELWAQGEEPKPPPAMTEEFSFDAFRADADPTARCRRLGDVFAARFAEHPSAEQVVDRAVKELRALGHDLWSWDRDRIWGRSGDKSPGAGLMISLYGSEEDDDDDDRIGVWFTPPA